ncbi:MAG: GNAT family N-acetyltransferase [Paraclostridium sp.]
MLIRQEEIKDYNEIREMVKTAFETAEHTDGTEYILVDKLRKSTEFIPELALVAEEEGKILGHIMFTKIKIGNEVELALAPLSVSPSAQRKGVGTALMNNAHKIAKDLGYDIIVVLGSEKYYPRVGYKPASEFGISAPFDVPNENFMALSLNDAEKNYNGTVEYAKEILGE